MPARLLVYLADSPARDWLLDDRRAYVVGRDADADLIVDDDRISRRHACLSDAGQTWSLTDLGSKNGTAIEGLRIADAPLAGASWVSFGGVPARFEQLAETARQRLLELRHERRQTTQALTRGLDPAIGREALLDRILMALVSLAEAERAYLLFAREDGGFTAVRARGATVADSEDFAGSHGAVERALATGRPVIAADALADAALGQRRSIVDGGIRAVAVVPLVRDGRVLGALYADSSRAGSVFTELDLELLAALAEHAALALDTLRLAGELAELSGLDLDA